MSFFYSLSFKRCIGKINNNGTEPVKYKKRRGKAHPNHLSELYYLFTQQRPIQELEEKKNLPALSIHIYISNSVKWQKGHLPPPYFSSLLGSLYRFVKRVDASLMFIQVSSL